MFYVNVEHADAALMQWYKYLEKLTTVKGLYAITLSSSWYIS